MQQILIIVKKPFVIFGAVAFLFLVAAIIEMQSIMTAKNADVLQYREFASSTTISNGNILSTPVQAANYGMSLEMIRWLGIAQITCFFGALVTSGIMVYGLVSKNGIRDYPDNRYRQFLNERK